MNRVVHSPHFQSFAEFMRGNEFDIERFWIEHESSQGQRVGWSGAGLSRPRKSVPNPTNVEGAKPLAAKADHFTNGELAPSGNRHARLPLRDSAFTVSRDPLIMRLLKEQRKPRPLLALLIEPRTRGEQIIAALIFTLIAGAVFALLYALYISPAWLVTPFQ